MKLSEEDKKNLELEMLHAFIYEMNSSQLEKLSGYACRLLSDKRYKNK
jgi:hypothetical protein